MLKIAVFGGTFNPIHNGHVHMVRQFAEKIGADQVLLIPTSVPPHKQADDLASAQDRLEMCRLAFPEERFRVSDLEIRRGGPSYTSDTLRELKKLYPDSELYLITGEDMFLTLDHWYEPEVIFSFATVCAAPRSWDGCEPLQNCAKKLQQMGAKTLIADIRFLPISSTMVREAVKEGNNISGLVPKAVESYILEHHLYLE